MKKLIAVCVMVVFCVSCAGGGSLRGVSVATKPTSSVPQPIPPSFEGSNNTIWYVVGGAVLVGAAVAAASSGGGGSSSSNSAGAGRQ